jgi:hypothetical protein
VGAIMEARPKQGSRAAVFSLILGISGIFAWLIPIFGLPIALVAIALGMAGRQSLDRGIAIAGIVLGAFSFLLASANALAGAYLGFTGQLFSPAPQGSSFQSAPAPTAASGYNVPTTTPTPGVASQAQQLRPTPLSRIAGCRDAASITLSDVGRTLCVWGNVGAAYWDAQQGAFFVEFTQRTGDFYILSYGGGWTDIGRGQCVYARHEIERLGPSPVMVLDPADPLYMCE